MPSYVKQIIIFLDIDGVLRPFSYEDENNRVFPQSTLDALAHVLEQLPRAQLVLSSTWRVQDSFIDTILRDFRAYGGVLERTDFFDVTDPALHSERQYEIYEWLERHCQGIQAWIAIDDEELLEGEINADHRRAFERHVVKTDSHAGMTVDDARLAVTLLQNQLPRQSKGQSSFCS